MAYRENQFVPVVAKLLPELTWKQKFLVLLKKEKDLVKYRWYREFQGGIWSLAAETPYTVAPVMNSDAECLVAEPFPGLSDNPGTYWFQVPPHVTECIHQNLRLWQTSTGDMFPEDYLTFSGMSMVYHRLIKRGETAPCDCEKYQHRREGKKKSK